MTEYSWKQAQSDRGEQMNAYAVPHGAASASAEREARWWDSYNAAIADGHDSYDAERIADSEVPPRRQCTGPVHSASLSSDSPEQVEVQVRRAVSAVLRELDRAVMEQVMARSNDVIDLAELAEVVERGEQQ